MSSENPFDFDTQDGLREKSAERRGLERVFEGIDIDALFQSVLLPDRMKRPGFEEKKAAVKELLQPYNPTMDRSSQEYTEVIHELLERAETQGLIPHGMKMGTDERVVNQSDRNQPVFKEDHAGRLIQEKLECVASFIVESDSILKTEALARECMSRLVPFQFQLTPPEMGGERKTAKAMKANWQFIAEGKVATVEKTWYLQSLLVDHGRFVEGRRLEDRLYEVLAGLEIPRLRLERGAQDASEESRIPTDGLGIVESPSEPSQEEIDQTERIREAKELVDIRVASFMGRVRGASAGVCGTFIIKSAWLQSLVDLQMTFVALTQIAAEQGRPIYPSPILPLIQSYLDGTPITRFTGNHAFCVLVSAQLSDLKPIRSKKS